MSIWEHNVELKTKDNTRFERVYPIIIIGGGMSGILLAYKLGLQNIDVLVIEANKVASGQTKNTTAKISAQHNLIYADLIKNFGLEKAKLYAESQLEAISDYASIIKKKHIDCDFKVVDAYLYSLLKHDKLLEEFEAYQQIGIKGALVDKVDLPFDIMQALKMEDQAMFNPIKFINGLLEHINILEDTMVIDVNDHEIVTSKGIFSAEKIVFATHYPIINFPGMYFMRMHQERSYVIVLKKARPVNGIYLGIDDDLSFRDYHDLLLMGGGVHRCGVNQVGGKYAALIDQAKSFFPDCEIIEQFSAQDCMSSDKLPLIGVYSSLRDYWYVCTGYNKWGMSNAMVSATLLCDILVGKENKYQTLYAPSRLNLMASMEDLVNDGMYAISGLVKELFSIPQTIIEELPSKHGGVVTYDGKKVGVYKNEAGESFIVNPRCPHMGCELAWNPDELSWDCPCHGSRFSYKGDLLDNPSRENLENA